MAATKHVSFPNQREQCRLNKFTYTEKCSCGIVTLMCNYPFTDPKHKKGVCRASTCTDMRRTLAEDINAIDEEAAPVKAEEPVKTEEPAPVTDAPSNDEAESGETKPEDKEEDPKGAVRAE